MPSKSQQKSLKLNSLSIVEKQSIIDQAIEVQLLYSLIRQAAI
jgi:hypothetical protein